MKTRKISVMKESWDYLIILDACRYDYFCDMYQDYFSGMLESRLSVGSCTREWCVKSFPKMYSDVIYISSNPYINSKTEVGGFDARKHFCRVIDVWAFGWSKELGTVLPEKINESTLKASKNFPEKRFIVHYLQPHAPYISAKFRTKGFPIQNVESKNVLTGIQNQRGSKAIERFVNPIAFVLSKLGLVENSWQLREILKLQPASPMDAMRRKYGVEGLREAYKENLRIVLEYAAELCKEILDHEPARKIVITSDHGELLGERGTYGHGRRDPILLEVPWLQVTNVRSSRSTTEILKENRQSATPSDKPAKPNEKTRLKKKINNLKNPKRF